MPSRARSLCVNKEWYRTGSDSSLWQSIDIPRKMAHRVWDYELGVMLRRAGAGNVNSLQLSGSGITGKSLINIIRTKALAPSVTEISVDHCCNLKGCDILAFLQAISPSQPSASTSSSPAPAVAYYNRYGYQQSAVPASAPASAPASSVIQSFRMDGCKCATVAEVDAIRSHVRRLDVSQCGCGRIACLKHCEQPRCPGLCSRCTDVFDDSGLKCGACTRPRNPRQAMRVQIQRIHAILGGGEAARTRWTDVRSGVVTGLSNLVAMALLLPECVVCVSEFDDDSAVPRVLTSCGHSLCATCIAAIAAPWTIPSSASASSSASPANALIPPSGPASALPSASAPAASAPSAAAASATSLIVRCPECSVRSRSANGRVDGFPKNIELLRLLHAIRSSSRTETTAVSDASISKQAENGSDVSSVRQNSRLRSISRRGSFQHAKLGSVTGRESSHTASGDASTPQQARDFPSAPPLSTNPLTHPTSNPHLVTTSVTAPVPDPRLVTTLVTLPVPMPRLVTTWSEEKDWRYSGVLSLAAPQPGDYNEDDGGAAAGDCNEYVVYSGSGDRTVKAWAPNADGSYSLLARMEGHTAPVSSLQVDSQVVVSGSWDGTVRLWWRPDHSPMAVLVCSSPTTSTKALGSSMGAGMGGQGAGASVSVRAVVVDEEGDLILCAREDGRVEVWHGSSSIMLLTPSHAMPVTAGSSSGSSSSSSSSVGNTTPTTTTASSSSASSTTTDVSSPLPALLSLAVCRPLLAAGAADASIMLWHMHGYGADVSITPWRRLSHAQPQSHMQGPCTALAFAPSNAAAAAAAAAAATSGATGHGSSEWGDHLAALLLLSGGFDGRLCVWQGKGIH
ncbi:unnamed protein product [Closterium sp. Yama58-4]|nr:unnamed protein product [Closterium sp. Yama58-4]